MKSARRACRSVRCRAIRCLAILWPVALMVNAGIASAQTASSPIFWDSAMAAGGSTDNIARELAAVMSERLGRNIIVETIAGGSGAVAAQKVKSSAPNGQTYLFTTNSLLISQVMRSKPEFDMRSDFAAAAAVLEGPFGVFINPSVPVQTLRELISYAKANPGKLNYGSSGVGSSMHLAGEELKLMAGIDLFHISYKGGNPAMLDMVANRVQLALLATSTVQQQFVESGKLRLLAVTSKQRLPSMPAVPTTDEAGLPGYNPTFWMGLFAPAGTPAAILNKMNADLRGAVNDPKIRRSFAAQNFTMLTLSPQETQKKVVDEIEQLSKIVDTAKIERQ